MTSVKTNSIIFLCLLIGISFGKVWHVPSEVTTIKEAIEEHAKEEDVIQIAPGVYKESDIFVNKSMQIIGSGMDETIIDAEGKDRIFNIASESCSICSLTLKDARLEAPSDKGAGIYKGVVGRLFIENVKFLHCVANSDGGAFYYRRPPGSSDRGSTCFKNSIFERNEAKSGGAIYLYLENKIEMVNCLLYRNRASQGGSALEVIKTHGQIIHCTFANNEGDAIYYEGSSPASVNSIYHNSKIINNTYVLDLANDCINSEIEMGSAGRPPAAGERVIYTNPQFVNEAEDNYHLAPSSPCINAVPPNARTSMPSLNSSDFYSTDLEGNAREGESACYRRDIGAYEYVFKNCTEDLIKPVLYHMSPRKMATDTTPITMVIKDSSLIESSNFVPTHTSLDKSSFKVRVACIDEEKNAIYDTILSIDDPHVSFEEEKLIIYPLGGCWNCYMVVYKTVAGSNQAGKKLKGSHRGFFRPTDYTIVFDPLNEGPNMFEGDSIKIQIMRVPIDKRGQTYFDKLVDSTCIDPESIIFSVNGRDYDIGDKELEFNDDRGILYWYSPKLREMDSIEYNLKSAADYSGHKLK